MNQLRFRTRLVLILSLFAIVPALMLSFLWGGALSSAIPLMSGRAAWDSVASTGERAIAAARGSGLDAAQKRAVDAHERELRSSVEQARRYSFLASRTMRLVAFGGFLALLLLTGAASRVAGHLSRQLSRPLDELVGWTEKIAHDEPLPPAPFAPAESVETVDESRGPSGKSRVRGAPEFETLRRSMRRMAGELEEGRRRAIETERLHAFRESARRVAHELKNPLTPIRFAVERLRRDAPPEMRETIDVLATESGRLERMARSFAEFGRLPEGAASEVDVAELARYTATSSVPDDIELNLEVEEGVPHILGDHSALAGALSNILLNAVDASDTGGRIDVKVSSSSINGQRAVQIIVGDRGCGVPPEQLESIWEPYITHKPGGTGLGLAIARQAVWAHDGTVQATSTLGEGTEIKLILPVSGGSNARRA